MSVRVPRYSTRCCPAAAFGVCPIVKPIEHGLARRLGLSGQKEPTHAYDDGINLKDGYKVPPVAYAGKNFLECDKSLVLVDEAKLKVAKTTDCGDGGGDWKGVLAAYINAIGANGDVHLITPRGHQVIAKYKWEELVKSVSPATGSNTKVDVKVGDFAAFTKDDKGHFATMFKLAPDTSSDSHQM